MAGSVALIAAVAVLKVQCGACHLPYPGLPAALRVFDLTDDAFASQLSQKRLEQLATRVEDRSKMKESERVELMPRGSKIPPAPTAEDVKAVRSFVTEESISRAK